MTVGIQREQTYACTDVRPGDGTSCGTLLRGELGRHGEQCPKCGRGKLTNVVRVTTAALERAEILAHNATPNREANLLEGGA